MDKKIKIINDAWSPSLAREIMREYSFNMEKMHRANTGSNALRSIPDKAFSSKEELDKYWPAGVEIVLSRIRR